MQNQASSSTILEQAITHILAQPTAPFRETWVKRACLAFCDTFDLPILEDDFGNYWVNAKSPKDIYNASLVFVAHMDHPGMVINSFSRKKGRLYAKASWLGGGPMDIRNSEVKIFSHVDAMIVLDGKVKSHTKGPRGPEEVLIEITKDEYKVAESVCNKGAFKDLGPWGACLWYKKNGVPFGVVKKGKKWVTKAADDLIGVCALLSGLRDSKRPKGVVVLLSRAEESGFHGALHVLKRKFLNPSKSLIVSIETSSWLPGAEPGKGPVVRLGDRATIFDPSFVYWLQNCAADLAKKDKSFKYQRRVMDGGTCEATAFNCFGFRVAGISTPLENYHNQSTSGKPLPEAVNASDVDALAKLVTYLMQSHKTTHLKAMTETAFGGFTKKLMEHHREEVRKYNQE